MSLLERSAQPEVMNKSPRAIRISLGARKAVVDFSMGPNGQDHLHSSDRGTFFGTTGWLALGSKGDGVVSVMHPWKDEKAPSRTGLRFAPGSQAFVYISGINPQELRYDAFSEIDTAGTDAEDQTDPIEAVHEEGEFKRPMGIWVPGTEPTRSDIYTHKDVLTGIPGVEQVVVYSADELVRSYNSGRYCQ